MQVEDPLAGCTHETITRHTFTGFEEWRCSVCAEPFAPSLDAEKRITFAADALAVVERRRDDLESKLEAAEYAHGYETKAREEMDADNQRLKSRLDLALNHNESWKRDFDSIAKKLDIAEREADTWHTRAEAHRTAAEAAEKGAKAAESRLHSCELLLSETMEHLPDDKASSNGTDIRSRIFRYLLPVEKHERNCCEWHKAGGDLEYPCNRL